MPSGLLFSLWSRLTGQRPAPGAEVLLPPDLAEARARAGRDPSAALYLSQQAGKIVVAPRCVNDAGLIYEQDAPVVLPLATPPAELGHQARAALLAFRHKHRDLGNLRQTDWPAYRASKARSLKAFHAQFVYLDIETVNANLRVTGFPIGERHLFVGSYLAPVRDDEALGTLLFRVFGSCLKLSPPTDTVPTAT